MTHQQSPIRVLVVEDNAEDRDRIARLMAAAQTAQYCVTYAYDYEQAEVALDRADHDICLLDYQLGAKTGLDLLNSAAARCFTGPIVVLTGNDNYDIDLAVMKAGAVDFLSKSSLTAVLLERVIRYSVRQYADQQRFTYLAEHDQVTGLFNRRVIEQRIAWKLSGAPATQAPFTVVYFDLDGFKTINDSLGHSVGDAALAEAALRLEECCGPGGLLGRMGGDEFVAIIDHAESSLIEAMLDRVLARFRQPVVVGAHQLRVTISIGAARYPEAGLDPATLLANADSAMYAAKYQGRDRFRWFADSQATEASEDARLGNELRRTLERDELDLVFQPQFELESGRIVGLEALARWHHPRLGTISPTRFIALAEANGLMNELTDRVLETAVRQYGIWRECDLLAADVVLAVNVSASLDSSEHLIKAVTRAIDELHMPAANLELEFSEARVRPETGGFDELLERLKNLGLRVVIDDIGCGHSTLESFARRPVDVLKIDSKCLQGVVDNPKDQAMARAIIALGASLDMRVVAEGVETDGQRSFLVNNQCDFAQGYFYAPGLATPDLTELLATRRAS